jgi:MarR family transcriptional regulator, transcriptional regulator for hemolysin
LSRKEAVSAGPPLGRLVTKAGSSIGLRLTRAFAEAGVAMSPEQYGVLAVAAKEPNCSQADAARALGRDGPSLTRLSDALVRGGFIAKEPSAGDRRAYRLAVTARGREALAVAERIIAREESFIEGAMDAGAKAAVADSMRRIIEACAKRS